MPKVLLGYILLGKCNEKQSPSNLIFHGKLKTKRGSFNMIYREVCSLCHAAIIIYF